MTKPVKLLNLQEVQTHIFPTISNSSFAHWCGTTSPYVNLVEQSLLASIRQVHAAVIHVRMCAKSHVTPLDEIQQNE